MVGEKPKKTETKEAQPTAESQIQDLTELLKRKQAEFENYQKRMEKQQTDQAKFASLQLIKKLLPIYDMLRISLDHTKDESEFVNGIKLIHQQFADVLKEEGVEKVDLVGKPFDAAHAQALQVVDEKDTDDNIIIREISPCYTAHGQVIQYAKVIVNRKGDTNE